MDKMHLHFNQKEHPIFDKVYQGKKDITFMVVNHKKMEKWCHDSMFKYDTAVKTPFHLSIRNRETGKSRTFRLLDADQTGDCWVCLEDDTIVLHVIK